MVKEKELTLQDVIEGDILKNVNAKIKELESKKSSLENEIDKKREELSKMVSEVNKEINQKIQKASEEAQEKINEANKVFKEAENKLKISEAREKDSEAIVGQIANLEGKKVEISELQKQVNETLSVATEREHKANLLIEQYTKKLEELGVNPEEKKEPELKKKNKK